MDVDGTGNSTVVELTVPGNATNGTVVITIDGQNYTGVVENGVARVDLGNVTPGVHNATVTYIDENGNDSSIDTTIAIPKWSADVNMTVTEGLNGTTITVTVDPATDGIVLVNIDGEGYYVNMTNGSAEVTIKDLEAGNHTATVTFMGNDLYNSVTKTENFTSSEGLKLDVDGTGNSTIVEVTVPGNATNGTVVITIDGQNYTGIVENGTAKVDLGNVTPGVHNATVTYIDEDGNSSSIDTTIAIPKWSADVNMTVTEGLNGTTITVTTEPATDGIVLVNIDGKGYYVNMTNGSAEVTIPDLGEGDHTATVTFMGNDLYDSVTKTENFTTDGGLKLDIDGTGNSTVVEVHVPGNATNGTVVITIDGQNYTGVVENGTAKVDLGNVTPGVHNATVTYIDEDGNSSSIDTTIAIPKWSADVNMTVTEGLNGTTITVTTEPATDGIVLVNIDGKGYYVNMTNGSAEVTIPDLGEGDHTATVTFMGNDLYDSVTKTENFTTDGGLKLDVNGTGNSTVVEVKVPGNATNGTVIIVIDGQNYTGEVENGTAKVDLGNVTPGMHNATVIYVDCDGNKSQIDTTIAIPKWDASVNATGKDIIEGSDEVISIKVTPENATGIVLVDIDGVGYYANLTDGVATVTVKGLKEGTYTAIVTYAGDDRYNNATTTAAFKVSKAIEISTNGTGLVIELPENTTGGNVTVIVDGKVYNVTNVTESPVVIPIDDLAPGTHNVTVVYDDGNGTTNEVNSTITVPKVDAPISVSVDNSTDGRVVVKVDAPDDATGFVIVNVGGTDYGINLTNGDDSVTIPITQSGNYTAAVTYLGDDKYASNSTSADFHANAEAPSDVTVDVKDTPEGSDVEVVVNVPEGQNGTATVTIDNVTQTVPVTSGENVITIPAMDEGTHNVTVVYRDSATNSTKTFEKTITVFKTINAEKDLTRAWNSPYDYKAEFFDKEGHVLKNTQVQFIINGKTYNVKTDSQGIAYLDANLAVGKYDVTVINPVTGDTASATTTIVKRLVESKDITMDFLDGTYYVVRAIDDDGTPVGAGEVVKISTHDRDYAMVTDSNGYARLKINLNPDTYTVTAQFRAYKVSNKLKVKQTLFLVKKTVTVKKSAKKLVIKAKLKWSNGKPIKGKTLKLKFKGKTYNAKTSKKGIAKFTIKKKVIKKLKKGKKYTYSVSYNTNTVKGKVKVKK